ncbi:MAG: shikimate kinase [Candidatus Nanopelagicales bacterium]
MSNQVVLVLVGAPGAGKTTVGTAVADRLGLAFTDTDELIAERAGKSIQDIFIEDGEETFRDLEVEVVGDALQNGAGVLSLGGGAVLRSETQAALEGHKVVWLDVTADVASTRAGLGAPRPVLLGNVRGQMAKLLQARRPVYESVASVTIDASGDSVEDTIERVIDLVRSSA